MAKRNAVSPNPRQAAPGAPHVSWEYCVASHVGNEVMIAFPTAKHAGRAAAAGPEEAFRNFGDQGWELIAVIAPQVGVLQYFFKRPKPLGQP